MSRSTIRVIIILASIIFIGLVTTQIIWVQRAYEISERQAQHEIEVALNNVVRDIQRHSGDSTFLIDPVKMVENHFYRVQINEELQPAYLENMLQTEFLNREINFDFQYSIYNCFNDSVVYSKLVTNEQDPSARQNETPSIQWENDGHYFSVFFPTLDFEIWSEMKFWIASSVILLIVLIFFSYVISVILKQKRLSEIKNDFINNMTHELKTPISTIALSSEVLLKGSTANEPKRIKNYAKIIQSENQRLQTQVERVLQIARLDKESLELNKQALDIHELISDAVPTIVFNFESKDVKFNTALNAKNSMVQADEMHITNILYNLLDNAAKYGGEAPLITIRTESNEREISIFISDDGPGIPKEHQRLVFEKFYRIPTGDVHDVKGFGIGLHYVKTITEAHGGKVKLRSAPTQGATFEIRLPLEQ